MITVQEGGRSAREAVVTEAEVRARDSKMLYSWLGRQKMGQCAKGLGWPLEAGEGRKADFP